MNKEIFYTVGDAKRDKRDKRDFRASGIVPTLLDIPKQVFILDELFPPKHQFSRGSCTAQAQSHHKERQEKKASAARFIMAETKRLENNTEYGAYTRDSFTVVKNVGACSEELYPEPAPDMSWEEYIDVSKIPEECYKDAKQHKSQSYWRVEKDLTEIKSLLLQRKEKDTSIVCSMAWYKEFNRPNNGQLPIAFTGNGSGHAVELKGWDDFQEYLIFKNSWGTGWGDGGYFYMPFSIFNKVIWDLWTSMDLPEDLPVDNYYGEKRTWSNYMLEKSFAFNPWLFKQIGRLPNNREIKGLAYGKWDFETIFRGVNGDMWLKITKPEAIKNGLINK
jgi:hypothetical protein